MIELLFRRVEIADFDDILRPSFVSSSTDQAVPLTTFAFTPSRSSEIIATGPGSDLYVSNVTRGSIVRQVSRPRS